MKLISTKYFYGDGTWVDVVEEYKDMAPRIDFGRVCHVTQTTEMSKEELQKFLLGDYNC